MDFFTPAMRALQDRHDGRRLADRLNERRVHDAFLDAEDLLAIGERLEAAG